MRWGLKKRLGLWRNENLMHQTEDLLGILSLVWGSLASFYISWFFLFFLLCKIMLECLLKIPLFMKGNCHPLSRNLNVNQWHRTVNGKSGSSPITVPWTEHPLISSHLPVFCSFHELVVLLFLLAYELLWILSINCSFPLSRRGLTSVT